MLLLLALELLRLSGYIATCIVLKVVIGCNGQRPDSSIDQEELSLARLEVVSTNEGPVTLSEFSNTKNKSIAWTAPLGITATADHERSRLGYLRIRRQRASYSCSQSHPAVLAARTRSRDQARAPAAMSHSNRSTA
jgi:hypothetical protein